MSERPTLALLLLTYGGSPARCEYAYTTLHAALDRLRYSGPLIVHIADDGSPEAHRNVCFEIAAGYAHVRGISHSNSERRGYGANFNLASQYVHQHAEIVLPLEDDWELTGELDLDPLVDALITDDEIECIRLGYLGFTRNGGLRGSLRAVGDGAEAGLYLRFDPESEEPHVFAGHPRIESVAFERRVGPWPEGLAAGATEFAVCHNPEARRGIAWPLALRPNEGYGVFAHIGSERTVDIA